MEVALLAGLGVLGILFAWSATKWRAAAAREAEWRANAATAHAAAATLRALVQAKEDKLEALEEKYAATLSGSDLSTALTGLFGGKPGTPGASGPGDPSGPAD